MRWARWVDGLTVAWEQVNPGIGGELRTRSFGLTASRRLLTHRLDAGEIDNDLGDRIAAELVRPGLVESFESVFAGVVTSTAADPSDAWERFYAQTLDGLREDRPGAGAIATFGAIYRHALSLQAGDSLLDAGSCFGFLCLLATERGLPIVTGTDVSAPTVALAGRVAARLGSPARFACADVRAGLPGQADTVTALHVLEHLDPAEVPGALRVLCAAARRRVVVAVPLERTPDPTYGHRTAFDGLDALRVAAAGVSGWRADVHEHRGGWLVLDRRDVR